MDAGEREGDTRAVSQNFNLAWESEWKIRTPERQ